MKRYISIFSIPIPIPNPTPIYRDLGVGVGIGIGVDFFLPNRVQLELLEIQRQCFFLEAL